MRSGFGSIVAKLGFAALLGAIAFQVSGMTARTPAAAPTPRAAPVTPAPPVRPAAAAQAPAAPKPEIEPGLIVKRILDTGGPLKFGDYHWDDAGVPAGPIIVTIDLAAQTLSVFRDGYEIGATAILYGADNKPTPLGTFPISEKDATHVSSLYGAPMPYMLRLTNDGVSIHGSKVEWGYATHGCIGVPVDFAKRLFAQVKLGDRVIITKGKMLDVKGVATSSS